MSVEQNLEEIMSARYGKDVRQSIHDAIYDINEVAKRAEFDASTAPASAKAYAEAALASEQAAQNAKQAAEEAAQQAMSGTPAGYADLVEEVRSLKVSNDTVLAEAGTFVGRVLLDKMYGMSIQDGTPTPSVPVAINSAKANFSNCGKNFANMNTATTDGCSITNGVVTNTRTDTRSDFRCNIAAFHNDTSLGVLTQQSITNTGKFSISFSITDETTNKLKIGHNGSSYNFSWTITWTFGTGDFVLTFDCLGYDVQTVGGLKIDKVMVRLASVTNADYEPFVNNLVTTDLVLRAIEVTSSDDYNLVKDGKYYVADTLEKIDGGYQITRRVGTLTLTGSEGYTWYTAGSNIYASTVYSSPQIKSFLNDTYINRNRISNALANRLLIANVGNLTNGNFSLYYSGLSGNDKFIMFCIDGVTTSSAFNTWLQSNNTEIVYRKETPTIETVSNADAKLLLSLKSYDEATYVAQTEDTEGVMVLKYGSTELSNMAVTGYVEGEQNSIRLSDLESEV